MMKLASRIATGIAILGLAAPAFASTNSKSMTTTSPAPTSLARHHRAHKKVASATKKKPEAKKTVKKVEKKGAAVNSTKTETPAAPSAAPAPASK